LIEVGEPSFATAATRRVASVFSAFSLILIIIWVVRGPLSLSQYSLNILLVAILLGFIAAALKTRTKDGAAKAVSSFTGQMAGQCVGILILIFLFSWIASIQGDVFPELLSRQIPTLVIAAIATGLVAAATHGLGPRSAPRASEPSFLVPASSSVKLGKTTLSPKDESVGLMIKTPGQTVGCVLFGDVVSSFDTPMGKLSATFAGPVYAFGVPFKGEKLSGSEVQKVAGKTTSQLIDQATVGPIPRGSPPYSEEVDLPFVHIRRDGFNESLDLGPISLRSSPGREEVKVGPFHFDMDSRSSYKFGHGSWFLKGSQDAPFASSTPGETAARWNGSYLRLRGDSMKLSVGTDGFSYSPLEVESFSPLHTLHVSGNKVTLTTRKFTLNVSASRVVLRGDAGSKATDSAALADDLRALLADTARKHIQDVMRGQPIDLDEMLAGTEKVLGKYA